jgi:hypothetical protein
MPRAKVNNAASGHWPPAATGNALVFVALACAAIGLLLDFKAGCAGDSKYGAVGNPEAAMAISAQAFVFDLIASTAAGCSVGRLTKSSRTARISMGILAMVLVMATLEIVGHRLQGWGTTRCFDR